MTTKHSLRIILVMVVYFELELHQIVVKKVFLNDDLSKDIYMTQLTGFEVSGSEHLVYQLNGLSIDEVHLWAEVSF